MKKISAIVLVLAILLASTVFTACSGNKTPKNEEELVSGLKELDKEAGYADEDTETDEEVTYEELTSVDQLKKYPLNIDKFTDRFTGAKNMVGNATSLKTDGEMKRIKADTVTFKSILPNYVYCETRKSDNAVMSVFIPAVFSIEGELFNKDITSEGDASYDSIYGLIRLGQVRGNYDIYSDGDIGWIDGNHYIDVFCTDESDLGNALIENHQNDSNKYDYVRVDY